MFEIEGFEWDKRKAKLNQEKHGVSFEEAITVFYDDFALLIPDPAHSFLESRFILLGRSKQHQLLVVVHCERGQNIRIISARTATARETQQYQEQLL